VIKGADLFINLSPPPRLSFNIDRAVWKLLSQEEQILSFYCLLVLYSSDERSRRERERNEIETGLSSIVSLSLFVMNFINLRMYWFTIFVFFFLNISRNLWI